MSTEKTKMVIKTTITKTWEFTEEDIGDILAAHVGQPNACVGFDISGGGILRGAVVSFTTTAETEEEYTP